MTDGIGDIYCVIGYRATTYTDDIVRLAESLLTLQMTFVMLKSAIIIIDLLVKVNHRYPGLSEIFTIVN